MTDMLIFFVGLWMVVVAMVLRAWRGSSPWGKILFICSCFVGLVGRLGLAFWGHNEDVVSAEVVARIVLSGQSVYASMPQDGHNYNYGPVWFTVLGWLKQWQGGVNSPHPESFHVLIVVLLSSVDVAIAMILVLACGVGAGCFYLLAPPTFLITGFHSQIDNFALLFGLTGWMLLSTHARRPSSGKLWASAILMGISLATKHILILFPLWLLLGGYFRDRRESWAFVAVIYGLFGLSFTPWLFDDASRAGVVKNVFAYSSNDGCSLLFRTMNILSWTPWIDRCLGWVPLLHGEKTLWLTAMMGVGWLARRRGVRDIFSLYLMTMVAFSPAMADQYLVIPMIACAVFWRSPMAWVYVLIATSAIMTSPFNIGEMSNCAAGIRVLPFWGSIWVQYYTAQICLLVLIGIRLWTSRLPSLEFRS